MSESSHRHHFMKVLIFLALILVSCNVTIYGQDKEKSPLKLTIKLDAKKVCIGDSLKFAVRLKNVSKGPIVVDTDMIGVRTSLVWSLNTPTGGSGGALSTRGHRGRYVEPEFLVLKPGKSYTKRSQYSFDKKDMVASPDYTLAITYGQTAESVFEGLEVWRGFVDSNRASLSVELCQQS